MQKVIIKTDKAPEPIGPYSQAIQANGFLFLSGQIPIDPVSGNLHTGSFEEQCRLVLDNLKSVLEAGGSSVDQVVKVTIFLQDMQKFGEFNSVYAEYFNEAKPARACVEVSCLPKNTEIEIEAIALCS
ncbi:MAG: RidA family protein [SAR324 cluster bacterium]|nr:RidA family protein [SAR324 cluster bacterium]